METRPEPCVWQSYLEVRSPLALPGTLRWAVDFLAQCLPLCPVVGDVLFFADDLGFAHVFLHPALSVPLQTLQPCPLPSRARPPPPGALPGLALASVLPAAATGGRCGSAAGLLEGWELPAQSREQGPARLFFVFETWF